MTASLLERLDADRIYADHGSDSDALRKSIVSNLTALFNVRQGSVLIQEDYGLPDFSDLFFHYYHPTTAICREIEEVVRKFEPRLTDITVEYDSEWHDVKNNIDAVNGELHLVMRARVCLDGKRSSEELKVKPVLKGPGRLSVS